MVTSISENYANNMAIGLNNSIAVICTGLPHGRKKANSPLLLLGSKLLNNMGFALMKKPIRLAKKRRS
jgi:hypothetical protein